MACDLAYGRKEPCKDGVGGIKAVYIVNFDDLDYDGLSYDGTTGAITGITGTPNAYQFDVRATTNTFDEVNENSRDNGTSIWTGTLTLNLKKQSEADQHQLEKLSYGRPKMIVEYHSGIRRMAGAEFGVEVAVNTNSGGAMGDFQGYNLVGTSGERGMAPFVIGDLATLGFVIVEGTNS